MGHDIYLAEIQPFDTQFGFSDTRRQMCTGLLLNALLCPAALSHHFETSNGPGLPSSQTVGTTTRRILGAIQIDITT